MGIFAITNSTLISDNFKGLDKARAMGVQTAIVSIGGAVLSALSGFIAAWKSWNLSYLVFTICIPIFILVLFTLPNDQKTPKTDKKGQEINWRLFFFILLNLFASVCINVFQSNNAMFLEKTGLGNAAIAGTAQFIFMIVGIPAGLGLGFFMKHLGRSIMVYSSLCIAVGMFFIAFSHSLPTVYIGAFLIGMGFAIRSPGGITMSANMVAANAAAMAIGLNNSFGSVGNFVSPIVINSISAKINDHPGIQFIVAGIMMVVLGLLYFIFNRIWPVEEPSSRLS
jgi:MFS family permease